MGYKPSADKLERFSCTFPETDLEKLSKNASSMKLDKVDILRAGLKLALSIKDPTDIKLINLNKYTNGNP